jgi:nucleoside-diphosphate-sugar epimerase
LCLAGGRARAGRGPEAIVVDGPSTTIECCSHDSDRAKQELGWRPRPAETTIVETAESLRDLGLLVQ